MFTLRDGILLAGGERTVEEYREQIEAEYESTANDLTLPETVKCQRRQQPSMSTRQIRISEDLYARLQSNNREDETLGETLERLLDEYTLTDFADDTAELDIEFSVREATDGAVDVTPPIELE